MSYLTIFKSTRFVNSDIGTTLAVCFYPTLSGGILVFIRKCGSDSQPLNMFNSPLVNIVEIVLFISYYI